MYRNKQLVLIYDYLIETNNIDAVRFEALYLSIRKHDFRYYYENYSLVDFTAVVALLESTILSGDPLFEQLLDLLKEKQRHWETDNDDKWTYLGNLRPLIVLIPISEEERKSTIAKEILKHTSIPDAINNKIKLQTMFS